MLSTGAPGVGVGIPDTLTDRSRRLLRFQRRLLQGYDAMRDAVQLKIVLVGYEIVEQNNGALAARKEFLSARIWRRLRNELCASNRISESELNTTRRGFTSRTRSSIRFVVSQWPR